MLYLKGHKYGFFTFKAAAVLTQALGEALTLTHLETEMYFDMQALEGKNTYKLLGSVVLPRPIAWVVTQAEDGTYNAAPFSFFNVLSGDPPVVALGIGHHGEEKKDSLRNIERTGEFVVNLVPASMLDAMNITATEYPFDVDELKQAGLATLPSEKVKPGRIAGSPVALECRLWKQVDIDSKRIIVLARVEGLHVDDAAVIDAEKCYIDGNKLDLVGRMHGAGWYAHTRDAFQMARIPYKSEP